LGIKNRFNVFLYLVIFSFCFVLPIKKIENMEWLVYENSDEATQIFVGVLLILSITFVIIANIYFWVIDRIKNSKQNKN